MYNIYMSKPIIYLGSDYIYNDKSCNTKDRINANKALKIIEKEIKKLKVKIIRPKKIDISNICTSLWVRDTSFNIDNKLFVIPHMIYYDKMKRANQVKQEVEVIPYKNEAEIVPSNVNLDGGDIIVDDRNIFVGKGIRTDNSGSVYMKNKFSKYNVITIRHHALHLDCCLGILPNKKLLYSKTYIKRIPRVLREEYDCYCVEDYMYDHYEPNLATNFLLINNTIITAYKQKFERIYELIRSFGLNVVTVPFSNIFKAGGGVRCMTQWYRIPENQKIF